MKTALLVIDVQKIYTDPESDYYCEDSSETIERINRLINNSENNGDQIILIRHIHKKDGSDLGRIFDYYGEESDEFEYVEGSEVVEYDSRLAKPAKYEEIIKTRYSSFISTGLENMLRESGIEKVIICGFTTNFCCESTARNAHGLDFYVDFIVDATGTPGTENYSEEQIRPIVGEFLDEGFARAMSTDEFLSV